MKKALLIILLLLFTFSSRANESTLALQGDSAYMNDDFATAIELYEKALKTDGSSSVLYFNLGNAYYKAGSPGKAIINYERSLKLDPSNRDARINLDFVNSRIADMPTDNASLTDKLADRIVCFTTADLWAWLTLGIFACFMCCVAGYIFTNAVIVRKTCFFGGIILLILTISGIIISINAASRAVSSDKAVITAESVQLGTSPRTPRDKSEQAFLLHEGTKIEIIDSLKVATDTLSPLWYEVKVDGQHRAWINSNDVEII